MKPLRIFTFLGALTLTLAAAAQPAGRKSWNQAWNYTKDGVTKTLDLPHNWGAEPGKALYTKVLKLTSKELQKDLRLEIDGAFGKAQVLVNGREAARNQDGYASWTVDLNPFLSAGNNVIEIQLEKEDGSSYPGGGIYRNVWLTTSEKTAVAHWGSSITSNVNGSEAKVRQALQIDTDGLQVATISTHILQGERLAAESRNVERVYGGKEVVQTFDLADVRLWSPEQPNLYLARTVVEAENGTRDTYETCFGLPSSEEWKLTGVKLPPEDWAWNQEAWECRLTLLKQAGINAISCGERLPAPELLSLCDRLGFAMVDVQALSLPRDAQHPCVRFAPSRDFRPLEQVLDRDGFPVGRELKGAAPARIQAWLAYGGETHSFLQAQALDRSGNPVKAPAFVFEVKGPAQLECSGSASAQIRRTGPGTITVNVRAKGLKTYTLEIN